LFSHRIKQYRCPPGYLQSEGCMHVRL
jgi:hypothetical protein